MTRGAKNHDRRDGGPAALGTFPLAFVREFAAAVAGDLDIDEQLRAIGLPPRLLEDDRTRVTVEQISSAVRNIWRATGDEFMGLGSRPQPSGTFRVLTLGLVHTANLAAALERASEFTRVLPGMPRMNLSESKDHARVTLDVTGTDLENRLASGLRLAVTQRFASWLIRRRIDATLVEIPGPRPSDPTSLERVFDAPIRFDAERPSLHFDASLLGSPVMQDEESLEAYLRRCPEVWLNRRDFGTTTADRVRQMLTRGLEGAWPDQEELARSLSMSPQTLRRRLRDQGTSVSEIRDEIRRDAAIASLMHGEETVSALAGRLGFAEASSFHRAFQRWTGQSPGAYRNGADQG